MSSNTKANIDKVININIDNNIDRNPYALRKSFQLNTKELATAGEISRELNDLSNFAFYRSTVNKLGVSKARQIYHETKSDITKANQLGRPIKNPAALYNWKVSSELNKRI